MSDTSFARPFAVSRAQGFSRLLHWMAVAKTRRDLSALDSAALQDIGVSAEQAQAEAARPMWDAPSRWIKS